MSIICCTVFYTASLSVFGGFEKNGILPRCQSKSTVLLQLLMSGPPPFKSLPVFVAS
jgi:hypothetical protein